MKPDEDRRTSPQRDDFTKSVLVQEYKGPHPTSQLVHPHPERERKKDMPRPTFFKNDLGQRDFFIGDAESTTPEKGMRAQPLKRGREHSP